MAAPTIDPPAGPPADGQHKLSASHRRTLHALFAHPISHNLEWRDVVALFAAIGSAEEKPNGEFSFRLGSASHIMRGPHGKDIGVEELVALRHFATSAGWGPNGAEAQAAPAGHAPGGLLVVVDHHEARIYEVDTAARDAAEHTIRPYDPHHFLHHLTHKDELRERGQRAPEEASYYDAIAHAIAAALRVVLVGHGAGKSNAAHHLAEYLKAHHRETFDKVSVEIAADISHLTSPQLLEIARRATA